MMPRMMVMTVVMMLTTKTEITYMLVIMVKTMTARTEIAK